jgi:sulfur-oxidizing protein SoxY
MDFVGELTRRRLLQTAGYGVAVSSIALLATPADAIGAVPGRLEVDEAAERVTAPRPSMSIRVPSVIDDLETVPITVSVENGSFEHSSVESIYLLAQGAPTPELARFYPLVNGPTVEVSSRVSMAGARRLWAVARLTDGSVCMATADLSV